MGEGDCPLFFPNSVGPVSTCLQAHSIIKNRIYSCYKIMKNYESSKQLPVQSSNRGTRQSVRSKLTIQTAERHQ